MPSTPTSKSQVQAYRFMLRRMESALVRKDSVMMHDPMGSHMRSAVVGVLLAMVAAIGFVLFAVLSPAGSVPESNGVVIGKQSGAVYALITDANNAKRLVPTFNVTSARLILLANSSSGGGGAAAQGGNSPAAAAPAVVDDDVLQGLPRDKKQGIVDGPQLLPVGPQRINNFWDVCDTVSADTDYKTDTPTTSVTAGVDGIGSEITSSQPILVTADKGRTFYVIYRKSSFSSSLGLKNAFVVKAQVDLGDRIANTYRLHAQYARPISPAVLNAIPGTVPLSLPTVPNRGQAPSGYQAPDNAKIGDVLHTISVNGDAHYYVLVPEGKHAVSPVAAEAMVEASDGDNKPHNVSLQDANAIPDVTTAWALDEFPVEQVNPVSTDDYPGLCAAWSYSNNTPRLTVRILTPNQSPVPHNAQAIKLGTPSTDGSKITDFYLPTGQAAVVRDSTSNSDVRTGPVYVVSDLGVKYGFASSINGMTPDQVAAGIGLGDPASYPPAPDAIVKLLPQGAALDPAAALRTFDTVQPPATAGSYPSAAPSQQAQQPAGGN